MKYGIKRFESLLEPIGLSGKTESEMDKLILELSQIRNNLLHRGGSVDKQLKDICPWLTYKLGDNIKITESLYNKYIKNVSEYLILILDRITKKKDSNHNLVIENILKLDKK